MWIEIEALPFAYRMPMEQTALLLIDMQRDFLEPEGFGASLGNDVTLQGYGKLASI
ncbi:hypothetical protein [Acidithiobacillus ferrooxidans]|uniref:hypothetical protein n=1 Tax=Acidithiobacillus ferrooxidans TaxID=920 RepID=UPI001C07D4EF|nr:hypothetical protein [Acidithiobacillus ferrooxidans]